MFFGIKIVGDRMFFWMIVFVAPEGGFGLSADLLRGVRISFRGVRSAPGGRFFLSAQSSRKGYYYTDCGIKVLNDSKKDCWILILFICSTKFQVIYAFFPLQ